jgi:nucleotide-binding universal stress UspA family protein
MTSRTQPLQTATQTRPAYRNILLAVDSSDHANRATLEAVGLASLWHSTLTAAHVYAAKLHDLRFRQMEGGLPEQFREEQELERQRDVHDDLISRGLSIITDSYLDQVEQASRDKTIDLRRCSLEGKNYRELVHEANSGRHDLLVMGALGLGAVQGSRLGSVCQRASRRSAIDTLVIKQPQRALADGPIVVAVDGSAKSYGGLLTALALAKAWQVPLKVVSAFDPYYHYVAFNRIAGVLSEEAGKVFRFQEQEQLHEEIIDSGLAKIYQGHLELARDIAAEQGVLVETQLLDGKPHEVIARYLKQENPSLLVLGKLGIHADEELDIGGNAEALLRDCDCAVLLSQREYRPPLESIAAVTTSWTHEAEARMERVPSFVRNMARMAILRYAQQQGHTVITEGIVEEATAQLMPGRAEQAMQEIVEAYDRGDLKRKPAQSETLPWTEAAQFLLEGMDDPSLRENLRHRAEKKARTEGMQQVELQHLQAFLDQQPRPLHWQAAALARLMRVPEGFMRDASKQRIEDYARNQGLEQIDLATAEAGLTQARHAMEAQLQPSDEKKKSACPFSDLMRPPTSQPEISANDTGNLWTSEARSMLNTVPIGFCRDMTVKAAETIAEQSGLQRIEPDFVAQVMATFKSGSAAFEEAMPWEETARDRIARAPELVRGMLGREIEGWARREGLASVDHRAVDAVKALWAERGVFHLDPNDPRSR